MADGGLYGGGAVDRRGLGEFMYNPLGFGLAPYGLICGVSGQELSAVVRSSGLNAERGNIDV